MSKSFITGFPRIGEQRELKFALEKFWAGKIEFNEVEEIARELRKRHWNYQKEAKIDFISVNDFSYYDLVLDNIITFGCIPPRFEGLKNDELYFSLARGNKNAVAMEMTKWFNTNYHYIVPELSSNTTFSLNPTKILSEYKEAKSLGINGKINLIGPITFLALSKTSDGSCAFCHLENLVEKYKELLEQISKLDDELIVQIDEPIFVTDRAKELKDKIIPTYDKLSNVTKNVKLIFTTYFEHATEAVGEIVNTNIWGVGLDFVYSSSNQKALEILSNSDKVLFAGVVDGRNIWVSDIEQKLKTLHEIHNFIPKERLFVGTSCSLLHVPYSLKYEDELQIKEWLSFAVEKLDEVALLNALWNENPNEKQKALLEANKKAINSRKTSTLINDENVQQRIKSLDKFTRDTPYDERIKLQREEFNLPTLPTTTIGSFPQTVELRQVRNAYKKELITKEIYEAEIKKYIDECIEFQEECGIDVLVHGEPERNDMVEYFGEQLKGYAFSKNGWVQSYGSRCVKPPLLFGDVSRPKPMTVEWISYAQSKTQKIMKGMLTGPVTILNWSFVRDDKPRADIAKELALCINDEINSSRPKGLSDMSDNSMSVKVLRIPTNEELEIAHQTKEVIENR